MIRDIALLKASYDLRLPLAQRFSARLAEQVSEVVNTNNISLAVPIEARVKVWQSLSEKIERQKLNITDAIQVKDLVGLRVILLFKRDLKKAIDLVSSSLTITSTEDALDRLGVEMFGYQSIHLQAEIPESWVNVPTLKDFVGLQAEIQMRTAAQHIWAAASHKLQYKMESSVPAPILRSINRVAALLETVDLEFERALTERDEYAARTSVALQADDGAIDEERLNVDLLAEVLDRYLPSKNKTEDEELEKLLEDLTAANINRVIDLVEFINAHLSGALKRDHKIAVALQDRGKTNDDGEIEAKILGMIHTGSKERAQKGIFHNHTGLVRNMLENLGLYDPARHGDAENP